MKNPAGRYSRRIKKGEAVMIIHATTQQGKKQAYYSDRANRPVALPLKQDGIPQELKDRRRFVAYTFSWKVNKDGVGKWDKPPKSPRPGLEKKAASSTNSATWGTFAEAVAMLVDCKADGIGIVLGEEDGIVYAGIDLDNCRDPETGRIEKWAWEIIRLIDSYTEVSPSGTGVKIIVKIKATGKGRKAAYGSGEVEIYSTGRYFTLTGHRVERTPATVEDRDEQVSELQGLIFGDKPTTASNGNGHHDKTQRPATTASDLADDQLIGKAKRAANGAKFSALWNGSRSGYTSESEADLALCNHLAWWVNGDAARIDRLFRQSGLMRGKWDREDYRTATITKALEGFTSGYDPRQRKSPQGGQGEKTDQPTTVKDIIRAHFEKIYEPTFKRGTAIYSQTKEREIPSRDACFGADSELIELLAGAVDAPRDDNRNVKRGALPAVFATWCKTAWLDMLKDLDDEEQAGEIAASAEDSFRSRVSHLLIAHVTIGDAQTARPERRPLIDLAQRFGFGPGKKNWGDVRGFQLWSRTIDGEDGKPILDVAFRHGLTSQVSGFNDLLAIPEKRFVRLCGIYGIGEGGDENRVKGRRAIRLHTKFVMGLLAGPFADSIADPLADSPKNVADSSGSATENQETVADSNKSATHRQTNRQTEDGVQP